ncbi:MAG TPA: hypothetical protein VKV96_01910 [Roseiarcus sp.]|nr:hypothetical protein [Roseiarcus sp.]
MSAVENPLKRLERSRGDTLVQASPFGCFFDGPERVLLNAPAGVVVT